MNKSKKSYELYLNDYYSNQMHFEDAVDNLIYLTNKYRCFGHVTLKHLYNSVQSGKAGTLLRKYDSIAFTVGYNEWK